MAGQGRKKPNSSAPKRPPGRPSKYSPELVKIITDTIELGMFHEQACIRAEISLDTFHRWQHEKPEFSEAIKKAEHDCEAFHLERIRTAPQGWQSSGWFLERKYRARWFLPREVVVKDQRSAIEEGLTAWQSQLQKPRDTKSSPRRPKAN